MPLVRGILGDTINGKPVVKNKLGLCDTNLRLGCASARGDTTASHGHRTSELPSCHRHTHTDRAVDSCHFTSNRQGTEEQLRHLDKETLDCIQRVVHILINECSKMSTNGDINYNITVFLKYNVTAMTALPLTLAAVC